MPYLPWNRPEAGLSEDRSYEALLSGAPLPDEAPADSRLLADLVSALSAPPAAGELDGFSEARAAYTAQFAPRRHGRALRWRPPMLDTPKLSTPKLDTPKLSPKIAASLLAGVLGLGGLGAAAYAGALPDAAQNAAHRMIGAPAAHPAEPAGHRQAETGAPSSTPAGPDAAGGAAFGLCTAYQHADGDAAEGSVALENLATAAGGADKVEAYCAGITRPGSPTATHAVGRPSTVPAGPPSTVPAHPTGKPSTVPAGPPSTVPAHPTGKPSTVPAGPPSTVPAHPTGKPSTVPAGPPTSRPTGR